MELVPGECVDSLLFFFSIRSLSRTQPTYSGLSVSVDECEEVLVDT